MKPQTVLITGCSSGIGKATAELLAQAGHQVVATARRAESVAAIAEWAKGFAGRCRAARLDVCDDASIAAAVDEVIGACGRIDVLVNNAGFGQVGAVEDLTREQWRAQFEANVFGVAACIRAVLPVMRRQGRGRIINISSAVAHITTPLMGAYCASKQALDSMSSALRMELRGAGVDTVMIEPGPVTTAFRDHVRRLYDNLPAATQGPCSELYSGLQQWWESEDRRKVTTAEQVAQLILRAVQARRPRARYRISWEARLVPRLKCLVPQRWLEAYLHKGFLKLAAESRRTEARSSERRET